VRDYERTKIRIKGVNCMWFMRYDTTMSCNVNTKLYFEGCVTVCIFTVTVSERYRFDATNVIY
jgi:hypothetical protein